MWEWVYIEKGQKSRKGIIEKRNETLNWGEQGYLNSCGNGSINTWDRSFKLQAWA